MNKIKLDSRAELIRNTISSTPDLNASSTTIIMIVFITAIVKSFLKLFIMGELWHLCITLLFVAPPRVQLAWSPTQTKVGENAALPKFHVTGFPVPVISRLKLPVSLSKDRTSQVEGTFDCGSRPKTRHWTVRLPRQEFIRGALTFNSLFV